MKLLKRLRPHNEKAILYNISSIVIPLLLFEEKSSRQREKWEGRRNSGNDGDKTIANKEKIAAKFTVQSVFPSTVYIH